MLWIVLQGGVCVCVGGGGGEWGEGQGQLGLQGEGLVQKGVYLISKKVLSI